MSISCLEEEPTNNINKQICKIRKSASKRRPYFLGKQEQNRNDNILDWRILDKSKKQNNSQQTYTKKSIHTLQSNNKTPMKLTWKKKKKKKTKKKK